MENGYNIKETNHRTILCRDKLDIAVVEDYVGFYTCDAYNEAIDAAAVAGFKKEYSDG